MSHITNATQNDFDEIIELFEKAIQYQKANNYIGWNSYDKEYIRKEITNKLLFKIVENEQIACIFSVCYTDAFIWRDRDKEDAIYLHRAIINQQFAGKKTFQTVLDWAIQQAKKENLRYIRIDTWADNHKLINYYKNLGFAHIETYTTPNTEQLPIQHRALTVALLQFDTHISKENIYIIGAGAIGKALAVFLKHENKHPHLIRGSVDNAPTITEDISIEKENGVTLNAEIVISTLNTHQQLDGIIILANKSFGNKDLAKTLKARSGNSPIILLQNGLGVEAPFIENAFPEVYRCVLFATSQVITPTTIRFKPVSTSPIGIEKGTKETLNQIVNQLDTPHFQFRSEPDIQPIIWQKAVINSVFNSVCPLLEIDNGIFHRNEQALAIARNIIKECISIANLKGISLDEKIVEEGLLRISKFSDGQWISTLQDIKSNRPTEIDTLNLEIAKIADTLNKPELVRETRLLGELTKLKSDLNLRK
jgi:2-dehydropantoate 2-reductase